MWEGNLRASGSLLGRGFPGGVERGSLDDGQGCPEGQDGGLHGSFMDGPEGGRTEPAGMALLQSVQRGVVMRAANNPKRATVDESGEG